MVIFDALLRRGKSRMRPNVTTLSMLAVSLGQHGFRSLRVKLTYLAETSCISPQAFMN